MHKTELEAFSKIASILSIVKCLIIFLHQSSAIVTIQAKHGLVLLY